MTEPRHDDNSTQFGLWLRNDPKLPGLIKRDPDMIASKHPGSYITTDIDYIWHNYRTGKWIMIEEKRKLKVATPVQASLYQMVDKLFQCDPNYRGFHVFSFEHTNPDDGYALIDRIKMDREGVLKYLIDVVGEKGIRDDLPF